MTDHSTTPWFADDRDVFTQDGVACKRPIIAENSANWDANAAFIVKAVNNHDALVKALTDALCELTACANQLAARGLKGHPDDSVSRAQTAARAVLGVVGGVGTP